MIGFPQGKVSYLITYDDDSSNTIISFFGPKGQIFRTAQRLQITGIQYTLHDGSFCVYLGKYGTRF